MQSTPLRALPAKLTEFFERSTVPLSLADPSQPDTPLLAVNSAFERLTGYSRDEVVGSNCRFLQPPGGAGPVRTRIHRFLNDANRSQDRFVLPNIAKDGRRFVNLLYMTRLRDDEQNTYFLGSQFDVSRSASATADTYDLALGTDLDELRALGGEMGIVVLGTFRSLASSATIIAQSRLSHT